MPVSACLLIILMLPQDAKPESVPTPMEIVNERNRTLNAHDLDAFLATYANDVAFYVYPSKKIGDGKKHVEKIFSLYIEKKDVRTRVKKTLEADGYVVVESATTFGKKVESGIAIYEVRDGKIKSVRFLRDTLRAKQTAVDAGN